MSDPLVITSVAFNIISIIVLMVTLFATYIPYLDILSSLLLFIFVFISIFMGLGTINSPETSSGTYGIVSLVFLLYFFLRNVLSHVKYKSSRVLYMVHLLIIIPICLNIGLIVN